MTVPNIFLPVYVLYWTIVGKNRLKLAIIDHIFKIRFYLFKTILEHVSYNVHQTELKSIQ